MRFNFRVLTEASYGSQRISVIAAVEDYRAEPYADTKGIPTIGYGFNLRVEVIFNAVLDRLAPSITREQRTALKTVINRTYSPSDHSAVRSAINAKMQEFKRSNSAIPSSLIFSSVAQAQAVFDTFASIYEEKVDSWYTGIPYSVERAVFFSLAYNQQASNPLLGEGLRRALILANRAEAYYEICYNSNGDTLPGIAKRRYFEAAYFGLYSSATRATETEATQVGQTYSRHQAKIESYEASYGSQVEAANRDYRTTIAQNYDRAIQPAVAFFMQREGIVSSHMIDRLLVEYAAAGAGTESGSMTAASGKRTLLIGGTQARIMTGSSARDVFVSGSAADRMVGSGDNNLYYLRGNFGDDTILESPPNSAGRIYLGGELLSGIIKNAGSPNTYIFKTVLAGRSYSYPAQKKGADLMISISGGSEKGTVTIKDFDFTRGMMGISLDPGCTISSRGLMELGSSETFSLQRSLQEDCPVSVEPICRLVSTDAIPGSTRILACEFFGSDADQYFSALETAPIGNVIFSEGGDDFVRVRANVGSIIYSTSGAKTITCEPNSAPLNIALYQCYAIAGFTSTNYTRNGVTGTRRFIMGNDGNDNAPVAGVPPSAFGVLDFNVNADVLDLGRFPSVRSRSDLRIVAEMMETYSVTWIRLPSGVPLFFFFSLSPAQLSDQHFLFNGPSYTPASLARSSTTTLVTTPEAPHVTSGAGRTVIVAGPEENRITIGRALGAVTEVENFDSALDTLDVSAFSASEVTLAVGDVLRSRRLTEVNASEYRDYTIPFPGQNLTLRRSRRLNMSNFIMGGASRRNGFTDAAAAGLATALLVLIGGILLYVAHRCRRKLSLTNRRNPAAGYLDPVPVAVPIPGVSDALPTASAFAVWVRERGFSEDEDHLSTPMPNPANLGV